MLQRTKYNRFRNESVTSVDELFHGFSMNAKLSGTTASAGEPAYSAPADGHPPPVATATSTPATSTTDVEDGGTLCTLINKVSNLKFANSGGLLGIKSLPSAVKDLAVSKLHGGGGGGGGGSSNTTFSSSSSTTTSSSSTSSAASAAPGSVGPCGWGAGGGGAVGSQQDMATGGSSKKSRQEDMLPPQQQHPHPGEQWELGARGLVSKPPKGWLHSSEKISGPGVTYIVKYLGCIEVLRSMRSLDFNTRSQITREAISLVWEAVPGTKGALRKRKPPSKALSSILGKSNLQFAGVSINLNVSTSSLNLMTPDSKQIIANHHMQSISFASGGDPDTTDYVAYVAKDPVNRRACHILECSDGLAQDVISTIGQAFDLRFQLYLQCPSGKLTSLHDRVLSIDESPWNEEEEEPQDHPYYNNIPGKMPPPGGFIDARLNAHSTTGADGGGQGSVDQTYYQGRPMFVQQGSCDIYSFPEGKGSAPKPGEAPTYVNTQHIDAQVLAALQGDSDSLPEGGARALDKDSPRKDVFDMKPFEDAILTQSQVPMPLPGLHKTASVDNSSPLLVRSAAFRAPEELEGQPWYHQEMSRRDAESLLRDDGDFLVRRSTTNPGSYVLTGKHNGLAKHLLLVDPEGTVRTKDHIFESISHLIGHHRDNNLPIVSAGSELCLKQPVIRK